MIDKYIQTITLIGGRYFLVAGISFLFFYFLLKGIVENKKIQSKYPKASDYIREIGFSTLTIFIFGVLSSISRLAMLNLEVKTVKNLKD